MGFAQIGDTVYVGGEYQNVQNGTGGGIQDRPALPCRLRRQHGGLALGVPPQVNGTVFDVRATPDGKLLVGGSFTDINGAANTAGSRRSIPSPERCCRRGRPASSATMDPCP